MSLSSSDLRRIKALKPGEAWQKIILDASQFREDKRDGNDSLRVEVMRHWDDGTALHFEARVDVYGDDRWKTYQSPHGQTGVWFTGDIQEVVNALGCYDHFADAERAELLQAQQFSHGEDPDLRVAA